MADELIDICDENNKLTGTQDWKSKAHRTGLWHRGAHIWIYNSQKELLVQLRAKEKSLYPNMWDISVAGHVSTGEKPIESAIREIKEEIGLNINQSNLKFFKKIKHKTVFKKIKNNEFYYVYFLKSNKKADEFKLQKEEIQKIKFINLNELEKELENKPEKFAHHGKYWKEIISQIKNFN